MPLGAAAGDVLRCWMPLGRLLRLVQGHVACARLLSLSKFWRNEHCKKLMAGDNRTHQFIFNQCHFGGGTVSHRATAPEHCMGDSEISQHLISNIFCLPSSCSDMNELLHLLSRKCTWSLQRASVSWQCPLKHIGPHPPCSSDNI